MHKRFSRNAKCVSGNQTGPYFDFKIVILLSQQIHALKETTGQMCVLSEPVTLGNLHHVNPSLYWTMFCNVFFWLWLCAVLMLGNTILSAVPCYLETCAIWYMTWLWCEQYGNIVCRSFYMLMIMLSRWPFVLLFICTSIYALAARTWLKNLISFQFENAWNDY